MNRLIEGTAAISPWVLGLVVKLTKAKGKKPMAIAFWKFNISIAKELLTLFFLGVNWTGPEAFPYTLNFYEKVLLENQDLFAEEAPFCPRRLSLGEIFPTRLHCHGLRAGKAHTKDIAAWLINGFSSLCCIS